MRTASDWAYAVTGALWIILTPAAGIAAIWGADARVFWTLLVLDVTAVFLAAAMNSTEKK